MNKLDIILNRNGIPKRWYNVLPDLPNPIPPILDPRSKKPLDPGKIFSLIFPIELWTLEGSREKWIDIPNEILDFYSLWRPTPLVRARRMEKFLGTPAKIFFKNESVSPTGSFKPNTAIPQVYYNKKAGIKKVTTDTGAGQWGSALSFACGLMGLECEVYMVRASYEQKMYRRSMMQFWGTQVYPSPSNNTYVGKNILKKYPDTPGSEAMACSEATEVALSNQDTNYCVGSLYNFVCIHQSIIGLETVKQLEEIGVTPDVLITCAGAGSNLAGFFGPFLVDKMKGADTILIGTEAAACPTLTKGEYKYDYGNSSRSTPLFPMYTIGHDFVPPPIHSGGLRFHGMSPAVSQMHKDALFEARAYQQLDVFKAGEIFARTEGIIPAPEACHTLKAVIDEAQLAKQERTKRVIVFCLTGHGYLDLTAFDNYSSGKMKNYELSDREVQASLECTHDLPNI